MKKIYVAIPYLCGIGGCSIYENIQPMCFSRAWATRKISWLGFPHYHLVFPFFAGSSFESASDGKLNGLMEYFFSFVSFMLLCHDIPISKIKMKRKCSSYPGNQ